MLASKSQIALQKFLYLGFVLSPGECSLSPQGVQAILVVPPPKTKKQLRVFLGMAGYCRLWIHAFGEITQPIYEALWGLDSTPLEWGAGQSPAFITLKGALSSLLNWACQI